MVNNLNTECKVSFRFKRLNKLQAFTLDREILGASHLEDLQNNCYIGYVPLNTQNLDDINDYYVRQQVNINDCDIFIHITHSVISNAIEIPVIVNRMLKYIDCKLTFSVSDALTQ
jgi:hypothetical protein